MSNIFENAYIGKAYKMRNGRIAIFHRNANNRTWYLICEEIHDRIPYDSNGICRGDSCYDIVSEWTESIEEKELDELADSETFKQSEEFNDSIDDVLSLFDSCEQLRVLYKKSLIWAFKKGYRKATEEL